MLIKYIKSFLWRVAKRLSYTEEARCLKVKGEASEILYLEHRFVLCKKLDTSESIPEISGKFEMWCWRRMEKINWTDRVENEEILQSQGREEYPTNKTKEG